MHTLFRRLLPIPVVIVGLLAAASAFAADIFCAAISVNLPTPTP